MTDTPPLMSPLKENTALGFHNIPQVGWTTTSLAYATLKTEIPAVQSKHSLQTCAEREIGEDKYTDMHFLPGSHSAAPTICFDIHQVIISRRRGTSEPRCPSPPGGQCLRTDAL
ncbi:hypothetical protein CesoFtcFv8_007077 [Champsocephalus esox]|uniref:Uncharacterized protein n=1 Tax=Champsocephalus esox TaxID=159716 RepID=A0AAN8H454_9TELE|nr:hypothetical protein CesoFtcFv8_007077 [Champsocephalus esox]